MVIHQWSMTCTRPDILLSANDRQHHHARARRVAVWRKAIWAHALARPKPQITGKATLLIEIGTNRPNQHRDPSNWAPTAKVCADALTDSGFWRDDDAKHVTHLEPVFINTIRPDQIRITITWEEE